MEKVTKLTILRVKMGNLRIYEIYILSSEVPHFQKQERSESENIGRRTVQFFALQENNLSLKLS